MYPAQGICNFGELSRVAEISHSLSLSVKASVVYAAAAFVLSTESDNLSLTAEALPPPSFVCCCCCVVASSALSLELCLVPEVDEQECVHLPEAVVVLSYMVTVTKCGAGSWRWRRET